MKIRSPLLFLTLLIALAFAGFGAFAIDTPFAPVQPAPDNVLELAHPTGELAIAMTVSTVLTVPSARQLMSATSSSPYYFDEKTTYATAEPVRLFRERPRAIARIHRERHARASGAVHDVGRSPIGDRL